LAPRSADCNQKSRARQVEIKQRININSHSFLMAAHPRRGQKLISPAKARVEYRPAIDSLKSEIVLNCLKDGDRLQFDDLIEHSRLQSQTVLRLLLEMELKGIVTEYLGGVFAVSEA
jgi:predicted Rossmann fold nucleotide-binding protein DprA/Smf involved in DNA uptake